MGFNVRLTFYHVGWFTRKKISIKIAYEMQLCFAPFCLKNRFPCFSLLEIFIDYVWKQIYNFLFVALCQCTFAIISLRHTVELMCESSITHTTHTCRYLYTTFVNSQRLKRIARCNVPSVLCSLWWCGNAKLAKQLSQLLHLCLERNMQFYLHIIDAFWLTCIKWGSCQPFCSKHSAGECHRI